MPVAVLGFSYGAMVALLPAREQVARGLAPGGERFDGHAAYHACSVLRLEDQAATAAPVPAKLGANGRSVSLPRAEPDGAPGRVAGVAPDAPAVSGAAARHAPAAPRPRAGLRLDWRAAAVLGLVTSTFSTLVSQLLGARIGRDAAVDWMIVAAIPLRDAALQVEPGWGVVLAGVLFHQWADFSWAVVFFGLLGRWTARLRPGTILLLGLPWAVFTSASEWLFLVPVLSFWQPIFTLNQAWWIGLLVHLTSASLYPLFPWLRDRLAGRDPAPSHRRFARTWGGLAVAGLCGLGVLALLGWQGREPPHAGGKVAFDQGYMRRMAAHHAQGTELALLAAERAQDAHLRALARLMAAEQRGEIAVFGQWWRSWFGGALPPATAEDHAAMPGMLPAEEIEALRRAGPDTFDARFVAAMTSHHRGAVAMADETLRAAGDVRLRLMTHAVRHEQRGEVELMRGSRGFAAVGSAVLNMLLPAGEAPADRRPGLAAAALAGSGARGAAAAASG